MRWLNFHSSSLGRALKSPRVTVARIATALAALFPEEYRWKFTAILTLLAVQAASFPAFLVWLVPPMMDAVMADWPLVSLVALGFAARSVISGILLLRAARKAFRHVRTANYATPGETVLCIGCHEASSDSQIVQMATINEVQEWPPGMMHDGRVLYVGWEYVDKDDDDPQST